MKGTLVALALGSLLGIPAVACADPAPQPLSITIRGDGARATELPQYDPASPIAVTVRDSASRQADAVTVVASGPAGETVRSELTRSAQGSFVGSLALSDAGDWQVRLTARTGSSSLDTVPVTLAVVTPPPSDAWEIGLGVGTSLFVVVGGAGFLVLRRTVGKPVDPSVAQAA